MKNNLLANVLIVLILVTLHSCSLIKNPLATTNFNRVKYNSHLKYSKAKIQKHEIAATQERVVKTVQSFTKERIHQEKVLLVASNTAKTRSQVKEDEKYSDAPMITVQQHNVLLKKLSELEVEEASTSKSVLLLNRDSWWEDDIEDWPWLEIVLALIAFLIVLMIVSLLFSVIGGLVSSLLGLILLLILAYVLYTLWLS